MGALLNRFHLVFVSGLILIIVVLSFLIGREQGRAESSETGVVISCDPSLLSGPILEQSEGVQGEGLVPQNPEVLSDSSFGVETPQDGRFVGSKNGSKYYTPGCPGALRIQPNNYRWFSSEEDATMQGYSRGSC